MNKRKPNYGFWAVGLGIITFIVIFIVVVTKYGQSLDVPYQYEIEANGRWFRINEPPVIKENKCIFFVKKTGIEITSCAPFTVIKLQPRTTRTQKEN